jgi:RNA recognition motif-containing protein
MRYWNTFCAETHIRFAFVDFSSPENQKLAVDLSERLLEGRKLLIKLGKSPAPCRHVKPYIELDTNIVGNDHTANPEARTPKPIKPKGLEKQPHGESATLFVGNLPFDATEQGLRDMIESSAMPKGEAKPEAEDESESDDENSDGEGKEATTKKSNPAQTPATNRGGKNSGLRKVRLGAFEDTGRCKGWVLSPLFSSLNDVGTGHSLTLSFTWLIVDSHSSIS